MEKSEEGLFFGKIVLEVDGSFEVSVRYFLWYMPEMQNYTEESEKLIQPKCLLCMQSKKFLAGKFWILC